MVIGRPCRAVFSGIGAWTPFCFQQSPLTESHAGLCVLCSGIGRSWRSVLAAAPLGHLLPVLDQARPGFAACLDGWLSPELPCGAHMSKTQGQGLTRVN